MDTILFPLTEWNERIATRGRGSGNLIRERWVVGADKRTLILGTQSKDSESPLVGYKYASVIRHFVPMVARELKMDGKTIFNLLIPHINADLPDFAYDDNKTLMENCAEADTKLNPFGLFPGKEYVG